MRSRYLQTLLYAAAIVVCAVTFARGQCFVLQPGDTPKRFITEQQLRIPGVDGLTIRVRPHWLSVNGRWEHRFVDQCVSRCRRTGDRYTLLVMTTAADPLSETNLQFFEAAAKALGERYASDPLCWGVHICGTAGGGASEELHWSRITPQVEAATRRMVDAWAEAFPRQVKLLAISGKDAAGCWRLVEYARAKCGADRLLVKNNALKANTQLAAAHNQLVVRAGRAGCRIGFEAVGPWGSSTAGALNKEAEISRQAGAPLSYLAVYQGDLTRISALP